MFWIRLLQLEKFIFLGHAKMCQGIDLFLKNKHRPPGKNYCPSNLSCFCKTRKSMNMSTSASKKREPSRTPLLVPPSYHLVTNIPCPLQAHET